MNRALLLWAVCWILGATARAADGTEFVLILDNSCSMSDTYANRFGSLPPSDPQRRAILGALMVEGLVRDTDDRLTVLTFVAPRGSNTLRTEQEIKESPYVNGTPFLPSLKIARKTLESSPRTDRMLVLLTDGYPSDYDDPGVGRNVLGPTPRPFDMVALGLMPPGDTGKVADRFLRGLVNKPEDVVAVQVGDSGGLVSHLTQAWARSLGSKALSGALKQDESRTFRVGRYVSEIMVVAATAEPSGPFVASLDGPKGRIEPKVRSDNGCTTCTQPKTHYTVWRAPHDPQTEGDATLVIDRARSDVNYGIILRYDLTARVQVPPTAFAGSRVPISAYLTWKGERFNDERFFAEDNFSVVAQINGQEVPLAHAGDGEFKGTWSPAEDVVDSNVPVTVLFRNDWMEERTTTRTSVKGFLPLTLRAEPAVLDFGSWRGERGRTKRCQVVDLHASTNADKVELEFSFEGVPEPAVIQLTPSDDDPLVVEACLQMPGCCGDAVHTQATKIRIQGKHPHYHDAALDLPVRFDVAATGWLRCWWPLLVALVVLAILVWLIVGIVRGKDFDPDSTVKVSGSERQMKRATALVLREQPRGRRGFYRNARVCLTSTGEFIASPRQAAVHIEAVGAGEMRFHLRGLLELKDRRTKKWRAVTEDEAIDGPTVGVIYRMGDLYLRFG